ncbi:MAG: hypothetical protein ACK4MG_11790 [Aquabacterium sp.]
MSSPILIKRARWACLAVAALLSACAPSWQHIQKQETFKGPSRAYLAQIPEGWKRAPTDSDVLLITRDGLFLQQIAITRRPLEMAFAGRTVTPTTPTQDLALWQYQLMRDDEPELARTDSDELKGVLGLFPVGQAKPLAGTTERVAIRPFQVDGVPAFRMDTRSQNGWGLTYRSQAVGFVHQGDFWLVRYLAPELHYAGRDQATFEAFLTALKLKEKCRLFCSD